eukprot:s85_g37.t1
MVRFLVERCASVNASQPLYHAAAEGHPDVLRYLLEGRRGSTPLLNAVVESHSPVVDIMLEAEVDVNGYDDDYLTPLMQAAGTDARMLKRLLDAAADVNQAYGDGATALLVAAKHGNHEAVTLLVEAYAEISVATDDAETALLYAVRNGDFMMVRYFIERCVVFNQRRVDVKIVLRDTPVHAVQNNDPATVQAMLTAAIDPNAAAGTRFKVDVNLWDD